MIESISFTSESEAEAARLLLVDLDAKRAFRLHAVGTDVLDPRLASGRRFQLFRGADQRVDPAARLVHEIHRETGGVAEAGDRRRLVERDLAGAIIGEMAVCAQRDGARRKARVGALVEIGELGEDHRGVLPGPREAEAERGEDRHHAVGPRP